MGRYWHSGCMVSTTTRVGRMSVVAEKRESPRTTLDSDAVVYLGGEQIACKVRDLALKGIGLTSPVQRRLGSTLDVHFLLPDGSGWMRTDAVLVRDSRYYGIYVWGIEFKGMDGWATAQLETFLTQQAN